MNTTLFLILLAMAAFHFIYEGIILPSMRMKQRFALFALRDQLRRIRAEKKDDVDREAYFLLEESLNTSARFGPYAAVDMVWRAIKEIKSNSELALEVARRLSVVNNAKDKRFKQINEEKSRIVFHCLVWNTLPLALYLFPIVLALVILFVVAALIYRGVAQTCKAAAEQVEGVVFLPEQEVEKMANGAVAAKVASRARA